MTQKQIGLLVLRYALVLVYLYFAISQLMDVEGWTRAVPEWASAWTTLSAVTIVKLNAVFELIFALLLALGVWIRPVSFILAGHLAVITFAMGYTPTGVRDFGLTLATLAHGLMEGERSDNA